MDSQLYTCRLYEGQQQIFLFPYLGGGQLSFRGFAQALRKMGDYELIGMLPPGHFGSKLKLTDSFESLLSGYYQAIKDIAKPGFVLYGHSMGGTIAYFLLKRFLNDSDCLPSMIVASSVPAPSFMSDKAYSTRSDMEIVDGLKLLGGIPQEFADNEEMRQLYAPIFRADYLILEEAAKQEISAVNIPAGFLWTQEDVSVPLMDFLDWRRFLSGKILVRAMPPGTGHMFVEQEPEAAAREIHILIDTLSEH